MTLQELRDRLFKDFLQSDTYFMDVGWQNRELNEAMSYFNRETYALKATSSVTTVAGTKAYAIPTDSISPPLIEDMIYDNGWVYRMTFEEKQILADELDSTGSPIRYYIDNNQLNLYPVPDEAKTLRYGYCRKATRLTSDTDVPEIPDEFQEGLCHLAAARMLSYDKGAESSGLAAAERHRMEANEYIRRLRAALREG